MFAKTVIRVLLVEDDEDDYLITSEMFENIKSTSYHLDWVAEYPKAIKMIEQAQHDVYLIDYRLGAYDGFELIRHFVQKNFEHPFIILTGLSDYETDVKAMQTGAADYLIKGQINETLLERSIRYAIAQKKNEQELKQANNTKDKLFSIIAHDLRGAIGGLVTGIEVLSQKENERREIIMRLMKEQITSTYNLLENLLAWSRSQRGAIRYSYESFELNFIIESTIRLLAGNAFNKSISLRTDFKEVYQVYADKEMITLVIRNLLSNAIKFTHTCGNIIVSIHSDGNFVVVVVSDNGVGMNVETMKNLFKKGIYYTTYGTNNEKGSGLGLNLCKEFIEVNGGEIWVESLEGKGTDFYFSLKQSRE